MVVILDKARVTLGQWMNDQDTHRCTILPNSKFHRTYQRKVLYMHFSGSCYRKTCGKSETHSQVLRAMELWCSWWLCTRHTSLFLCRLHFETIARQGNTDRVQHCTSTGYTRERVPSIGQSRVMRSFYEKNGKFVVLTYMTSQKHIVCSGRHWLTVLATLHDDSYVMHHTVGHLGFHFVSPQQYSTVNSRISVIVHRNYKLDRACLISHVLTICPCWWPFFIHLQKISKRIIFVCSSDVSVEDNCSCSRCVISPCR